MIIYDSKLQPQLDNLVTFFMKFVAKCDLSSYFHINISNDIMHDISFYEKDYVPNKDSILGGITILPYDKNEKIQILISENDFIIDIVLHELAHMSDFVLFSKYFCNSQLNQVRQHEYYQTFIHWSEFHVKQIDIPYMHLYLDLCMEVPQEQWLNMFTSDIKTFFYDGYTKKFLNKRDIAVRDIMWYLGELYVCNLYDNNNMYPIPQDVIDVYDNEIIELNDILLKCPNFDDFSKNAIHLHTFFQR